MINRYLAPCSYCGGIVQPDSGMVERVGQSWRTAHVECAKNSRSDDPLDLKMIRAATPGKLPPHSTRSPECKTGSTLLAGRILPA